MINLPIFIQYIHLFFVQILFIYVETKGTCGEFNLSALGLGRPQRNFTSLFTTAQCIIFPVHMSLKHKVQVDEQGVCPGYDDNSEAPVSCSVIKDDLIDMGVIHQ